MFIIWLCLVQTDGRHYTNDAAAPTYYTNHWKPKHSCACPIRKQGDPHKPQQSILLTCSSELAEFTFAFLCYTKPEQPHYCSTFQSLPQRRAAQYARALTRKINCPALVSNASVTSRVSPFDLFLSLCLLLPWQPACCSLVLNELLFLLATWICHLTSRCNLHCYVTAVSHCVHVLRSLANTVLCFGLKTQWLIESLTVRPIESGKTPVQGPPWWTCQRWSHFFFKHKNGT